jgi:hypothetical protein
MSRLSPGADPVPVQWFFTDPNAIVFPGLNRTGSLNWLPAKIPDDGIGEVLGAKRTWVNGAYPTMPLGKAWSGDEADFLNGGNPDNPNLVLNQWGVPVACAGSSGSGSGSGSGGGGSVPIPEACGHCTLMPLHWRLTVGNDFTTWGCTNCASLNGGVWILNNVALCEWKSDPFSAICPGGGIFDGPVLWHLYLQVGFGWRLFLENSILSFWAYDPIADANFACLGSNTFVNPGGFVGTCHTSSPATIVPA